MSDIHGLSLHGLPWTERIEALRSVNPSIAEGQSVAMTGPPGWGKTSPLRALPGLERVAEGRIRALGIELGKLDANGLAHLRRDPIGIAFQSLHRLPSPSALDTVALPLPMAGRRDAHARKRLSPALPLRSGG